MPLNNPLLEPANDCLGINTCSWSGSCLDMTSPRQWKFLESFPTLVTTSYYFFLLSPYLSLPKKSQFFSLKDKLWNTFWNLFDASYHKLRTLYNTLSNFPGDMCPVGFPVWYICWNCFHGPSLCLPGQWVTRFSYPVIERLYPLWCLEKLVALYETECFRDNSGLRNNSATWLLRFSIKSSAIDIWYMVSLVSLRLTWVPWKLIIFLYPTAISNEIEYEYWWIKVTKFMTGHRWIRSKIKLNLFTSCLNRTNFREKFDYSGGRKTLLYFRLYGLMIRKWDYRSFLKQSPWRYWPKRFFNLTGWGTGK